MLCDVDFRVLRWRGEEVERGRGGLDGEVLLDMWEVVVVVVKNQPWCLPSNAPSL